MKDLITTTAACGHTVTYEFEGSARDRKSTLWRLEHRICDECADARQREQNAQAAAANKAAGLPPLTGTEKQVGWAESIRQDVVQGLEREIARYKRRNQYSPAVEAAKNQILAHTEASWFIDNRDRYDFVLRELIRASEG